MLLPAEGVDRPALDAATDALQPITSRRDIAFLIARPALDAIGRYDPRWDGVEIGDFTAFAAARRWAGANAMIGVASAATRDDAMSAAEVGGDYVSVIDPAPDLVEWWAEIMASPIVAGFTGSDAEPIAGMIADGLDLLVLSPSIWTDPVGPVAAVARAQALIDQCVDGEPE